MPFVETTATKKIIALQKRIQGIAGGTSASKTISVLLKLIALSQSDTTPKLTSVVSETVPHLKRGAIRDFLNIMLEHGYFKDASWNKTDFTYTFETGSKLEFFSADSPDKVRGPRRDRLFLNEGNNVTWQAADQLMVRTRELIIVDWNPTNEFWWYDQIMPYREHDFITVTYKDNEALAPEIIRDIESHKHNKNWWRVFGEGLLGEAEGRIYTGWKMIDEVPHEARLERRGLDFGYTNDPSCVVDVYYYNGGYIFDEQLYRKGMSNKQLADFINALERPGTLVIADSAEPKSIDELRQYGLAIVGANKGPGSVLQGIQKVQDQQVSMTKRSVNIWKEYRNYMWLKDKLNEDIILNEPEDAWNHGLDPIRYVLENLLAEEDDDEKIKTSNIEDLIY